MTRFAAVLSLALLLAFVASASISQAKDKKKAKPKGDQQEYMTIKMNDAFISSVEKKQPDKHKGQSKPSNTLSR